MCNQDISVGYLCPRALHVQPSDAHIKHLPPLQPAHSSLQAIQWKCNHARPLNSVLKVRGSLGHVHTPHTVAAVLRGTTGTRSHMCLYLTGVLPPCNGIKQSPALCCSSRWAGRAAAPRDALQEQPCQPPQQPQQNRPAQGERSNPPASTGLETPNDTLPALLLGLHPGDPAAAQDLEQLYGHPIHPSPSHSSVQLSSPFMPVLAFSAVRAEIAVCVKMLELIFPAQERGAGAAEGCQQLLSAAQQGCTQPGLPALQRDAGTPGDRDMSCSAAGTGRAALPSGKVQLFTEIRDIFHTQGLGFIL